MQEAGDSQGWGSTEGERGPESCLIQEELGAIEVFEQEGARINICLYCEALHSKNQRSLTPGKPMAYSRWPLVPPQAPTLHLYWAEPVTLQFLSSRQGIQL